MSKDFHYTVTDENGCYFDGTFRTDTKNQNVKTKVPFTVKFDRSKPGSPEMLPSYLKPANKAAKQALKDGPVGTVAKKGPSGASAKDKAAAAAAEAAEDELDEFEGDGLDDDDDEDQGDPDVNATGGAISLAELSEIDVMSVPTADPDGRVTKTDVQNYLDSINDGGNEI